VWAMRRTALSSTLISEMARWESGCAGASEGPPRNDSALTAYTFSSTSAGEPTAVRKLARATGACRVCPKPGAGPERGRGGAHLRREQRPGGGTDRQTKIDQETGVRRSRLFPAA